MATIHEVALQAGVSATTVSRYLNKRIGLPASTASRIDAAIAALNYRPNLLAKRLSTGKTEAIGLVTPDIGNPFFAELAAAVEDEADRHGYSVFMTSTHGEREREIASLERLADRHVDGLIMLTNSPDDGTLRKLLAGKGNVVLIDEDIPGVPVPRVFVNNVAGALAATNTLIAHGHRRIAHVGGPRELMSVRERFVGFSQAMAAANLEVLPEHVRLGEYSLQHGIAASKALLTSPVRPTAVFAASDIVALGVLQGLRASGLAVPRDMSLVGFDDMPFAHLVDPALTTVRQPIAALGRLGFQRLIGLLGGEAVPEVTRLDVELVERQSVARP